MNRLPIVAAATLVLFGCAVSAPPLPLPEDAEQAEMRSFEVEFIVKQPYQYDGVHDFYRDWLDPDWIHCSEKYDQGWSLSGRLDAVVRRRSSNWVNRRKLAVLSVDSEYVGETGDFVGDEPQHVIVGQRILFPESDWQLWIETWCPEADV